MNTPLGCKLQFRIAIDIYFGPQHLGTMGHSSGRITAGGPVSQVGHHLHSCCLFDRDVVLLLPYCHHFPPLFQQKNLKKNSLFQLHLLKYFCVRGLMTNREPVEIGPRAAAMMTHITTGGGNFPIGGGRVRLLLWGSFLSQNRTKRTGRKAERRNESRRGGSSGCLYGRICIPPTNTSPNSPSQIAKQQGRQ